MMRPIVIVLVAMLCVSSCAGYKKMESISKEEARSIAVKFTDQKKGVDDLIIDDRLTKEYPDGWAFVPLYRKFVENGDKNWSRIGGFDVFVMRDGDAFEISPVVRYLYGVDEAVREHKEKSKAAH